MLGGFTTATDREWGPGYPAGVRRRNFGVGRRGGSVVPMIFLEPVGVVACIANLANYIYVLNVSWCVLLEASTLNRATQDDSRTLVAYRPFHVVISFRTLAMYFFNKCGMIC